MSELFYSMRQRLQSQYSGVQSVQTNHLIHGGTELKFLCELLQADKYNKPERFH